MRHSMLVSLFVLLALAPLVSPTYAATCNGTTHHHFTQAAASTIVQAPTETTVAADSNFKLQWQRGRITGNHAIYLMIAVDGPVRFEGEGFYVLLPKASAAFGITQFAGETRVVIPYYGHGAQMRGDVTVRPLRAGALKMRWAVVGHDGCRELMGEGGQGSTTLRVEAAGAPEIIVDDASTSEQPKERIFSPAGGRVVEVHDGRYRLVDESSRAEIANRVGKTPRFSPTGRFVAAYAEDGLEIIDTVDGKTVFHNASDGVLAWDNADSFAVIGAGQWGAVTILNPNLADPIVLSGQGSCHACSSTEHTAVRLDLENNVAVSNGDQGIAAASLTSKQKALPSNNDNSFSGEARDVVAFVKRQSPVTTFSLPKRWELRGGLKFSNLYSNNTTEEQQTKDPLHKFLVKPLMVSVTAAAEVRNDVAVAVQWRSPSRGEKAETGRNILKRLEEFGLPIAAEAKDPTKAHFKRDANVLSTDHEGVTTDTERIAISALARRIEQEVPAARGVFVGDITSGGVCQPDAEDFAKGGRIYERFQRTFRFQNGARTIWITHQQCADGSAAFLYPSLALFDTSAPKGWLINDATGQAGADVGNACSTNVAFCNVDVQIFDGHLLLLSSRDSRAIEIFDLETHRNLFKKYNLPRGDLLDRAVLSSDGKLVIQINADNSFAVFRMEGAALLFEGRYVDDEVVIWTPDGHFDATSEGAHYVNLRLPGRAANYTFEQFSARLKTPGLLAKLLNGETFAPAKLVSPPTLSGSIQAKDGHISGVVEVEGDTPLASVLVFQDGLLTNRLDARGKGASWDFDVELQRGTRWVSMIAVDRNGLASLPMGRDLMRAAARRVHVLSIGVDAYDDPRISRLQLARRDARRFVEAIRTGGQDIEVVTSRLLYEKDAGRDAVLAALRELMAAAAPGDTVMLFFAGHGVRGDDGSYFLATPDTRIDNISGTALPWAEVADILSKSRTRIAVFLDTCHSGAADTRMFSTNDAAATSLLERIPSGIVVFSASKGREFSEESAKVGGGVFTTALVKAIAGDRARFDTNKNGAIEISELYRGVKGQVTLSTEGRQTPWIARNQMVGDFVLF